VILKVSATASGWGSPLWSHSIRRSQLVATPLFDQQMSIDLAGRSGFKDLFVRAPRLDQWQFLANNGPQSAVFEACKEPGVDVHVFGRAVMAQSVNARIEARRAISSRD
jgi:hypothetical protein